MATINNATQSPATNHGHEEEVKEASYLLLAAEGTIATGDSTVNKYGEPDNDLEPEDDDSNYEESDSDSDDEHLSRIGSVQPRAPIVLKVKGSRVKNGLAPASAPASAPTPAPAPAPGPVSNSGQKNVKSNNPVSGRR